MGVYFCSQFPDDVPGNIPSSAPRAARAAGVHPRDQKDRGRDVRAEPEAGRGQVLSQLGTGEALVSTLHRGVPLCSRR